MSYTRIINSLAVYRSQDEISRKYGNEFFKDFREKVALQLKEIIRNVPKIGESIFAFNYDFCPCYIAWYKSYMELGLSSDESCKNIWMMNEKLVTIIPKWLMSMSVDAYIGGFRREAIMHEDKQRNGKLNEYDWKIKYHSIDANRFAIDITQCGMLRLSKDFDALGMYPSICRMDYLFSHYMGNGFTRTKTLGDGDDCCNCQYELVGSCEWSPEKGFEKRK